MYYYRYRKNNAFMVIAFIIIFVIMYDSFFANKKTCDDEFYDDGDYCNDK